MLKKEILIGFGIVLLIIGVIFDKQIVNLVISLRSVLLNNLMLGISFLGSALFVFIATTLLIGFDKEGRKYIPALWLTLIVVLGFVTLLKYAVARPRPLVLALQDRTTYSFPSGHAAVIFAPLLLIDKIYPRLKWVWLVLGVLVIFSRIYLGVHYMTDVIAGALFGYIISAIILRLVKVPF